MHPFLVATNKKFLLNFQGIQAELNTEEDFFFLRSKRKRNAPQFLPEVFTAEGSGSGSIRRSSHRSGYQSLAGGAPA
jgi:hypothetical protein